ncbi:CRISPR-associated protein Cas4 [Thermosipho atlanticus]|uniref:CRISPR-associated exonuclease Cas4 n=1 Tax=Thermosipho atlanticus DSM 15807 TaxID=1123380 RepID=A0A1M5U419_9BACT|nr:CRISPR-associated protein Cas4 [Thermosipho atlanticus]SHH57688.1 CRISPR-associated exonuclease Cas4 [Thermosipho atlanticus DSM 15807]
MKRGLKLVSGIEFYYYHICKRKLWFFVHEIGLEEENEDVQIGKNLEKFSYRNVEKGILINDIRIDFVKKNKIVYEIKKSKTFENANIWQIKYYIYYLRKLGVDIKQGIINYPNLRIRTLIEYEKSDDEYITFVIDEIKKIKNSKIIPEVLNAKFCKKCAYYEFCYV